MEEDQELKFVCKLCNKKFPCGKSLGGHMRSHVFANSSEYAEKSIEPNMKCLVIGEYGNGQTSYGLRENPRKTWRAVDANFPLPLQKICKQCGKGFQSLKALCGHMACHSERDKGLQDDHSWSTSENQKLVVDSESDTEPDDPVFRTGSSKSKIIKKIVVKAPFSFTNNGSSSISEIDGEEQAEVATCLMLLSRDFDNSNHKVGVNSVVESSDNNSIILETKSSSVGEKNDIPRNVDSSEMGMNDGDIAKFKENCGLDVENARAESSDSEYFLDECMKAEPGKDCSFSQFYRAEARANAMASKPARRKCTTGKDPELCNGFRANDDDSEKRVKYECFNCKRTFKSYQALGGHRPCHKRTSAYYESRYESGENSLDDPNEFATKKRSNGKKSSEKKSKAKKIKGGHVCPFCDRVFKNGQALGGHKRSHFIGGHENTNTNTNNRSPEKKKPGLLDLNLPAPPEDEDDEDIWFLANY